MAAKRKKLAIVLTNDNMAIALNKYIELFNLGAREKYVLPSRMSYRALKLHFDALKGAFETILCNQG